MRSLPTPRAFDQDGTILVAVTPANGKYRVSYGSTTHTFDTEALTAATPAVVIASLLPNPAGDDRQLEEVTLENKSSAAVDVSSWSLEDLGGGTWELFGVGLLGAGQQKTIVRSGMPMSLNNSGDTITLLDGQGAKVDEFQYATSSEGLRLETGH